MKRKREGNNNVHNNSFQSKKHNFEALAEKYPSLEPFVTVKNGKAKIDWNDPLANRELTRTLLQEDFQIDINLPLDHLCPTVTSRLNYILWIQDLLNYGCSFKKRKLDQNKKNQPAITGIDIGTGASCIYPLLGVRLSGWSFLATDIDASSIDYARENIARNNWEDHIKLRLVENREQILLGVIEEDDQYDFSMCNPPFFEHVEDKEVNPKRNCTATDSELATEGGELAFITKMIDDSLVLKDRVHWYTSLIGRKVTMKLLVKKLHSVGITNIRTTTFTQGYTSRWAIAWSFSDSGLELLQVR
eukprot:TRINITY_DN1010_c1_g1_i2.p1 TRINITY_DN1010_c1_g1~~TRINITY_DN1010_c1_g1_i2.p1  ORF type:complete len:303 (-),score=60.17 TRINITY_DN1010_c1_g1_i2:547-1455(-)